MEKKEWVGITLNENQFMGKLIADPQIVNAGGGNLCAFMKMKVFTTEMGANGQFTDVETIIPLIVMDHRKVESVVQKHCMVGRELYVKAYYKAWNDAQGLQHGFVVTFMKLGSKPYVQQNDQDYRPMMPPR